ncbi:hypothetical protein D5F01_LYC23685 [Larimichthys crocea]|uniref:Protein kinase domain-containing protein n=1 Tax=Larimichthys crocea TaxID=215358 RepID=A0A6G0HHU5_LARCR|nr:hypothetical protein D5F01_LYC23685 [Larimichthys crocea]
MAPKQVASNVEDQNIVKFFERFDHMGQTCLEFELLDGSLHDLLQEQSWNPLSVKELLVALDALKGLGVLHDVILVNQQKTNQTLVKPFQFRCPAWVDRSISRIQLANRFLIFLSSLFRAPEVGLGLLFIESVDVWGVGCVLAYLFLADHLFTFVCEYQMHMVEVLGQPEDHLLCAGKYTEHFFSEEEAADGPAWRLMVE